MPAKTISWQRSSPELRRQAGYRHRSDTATLMTANMSLTFGSRLGGAFSFAAGDVHPTCPR